jgi:hypothetical protein
VRNLAELRSKVVGNAEGAHLCRSGSVGFVVLVARARSVMTKWESELIELAIQWHDAKYAVEEALIRQKLIRAIRMVKKERRDKKVEKGQQK